MRLISSSPTLTNVIVAGNTAATSGGGLAVSGSSAPTTTNCAIVGNVAGEDGGGLHFEGNASASLTSVVVSHNQASGTGGGVNAAGTTDPQFTYGALWDNTPNHTAGMTDPTETGGCTVTDPAFVDVEDPSPTLWDLHLGAASELIDAGEPLAGSLDPDGSNNDIGAYGGPEAADWDLDGDGWFEWWQPGEYDPLTYPALDWDCDDRDVDVTPLSGCE